MAPEHLLIGLGVADLIQYLVPFIFLLIWVVTQIMDAKKKMGPPPPNQQPPRAPERVEAELRPQANQAAPPAEGDALREQVEEFLRRAGRGQEQPPAAKTRPRQPPKDIEILVGKEPEPRQRESLAKPLRPISRPLREPVAEEPASQKNDPKSIGQKSLRPGAARNTPVDKSADRLASEARRFQKNASRLGQRIIEDDLQFDMQLKSRFDHPIGMLAGTSTASVSQEDRPAADSTASRISEMLTTPQGVQQAIILNEILRRPVDRW